MADVHIGWSSGDIGSRTALYRGDIFVCEPRPSTLELCAFARSFLVDALAPHDPRHAQEHLDVRAFVDAVAPAKPAFIHHPHTKDLLRAFLADFGCDPFSTYVDVPRMRVAPHSGYLTSGAAYQFPPHRDTWYSAPMCQVNWWLPLWDAPAAAGMAFYPDYFDRPVPNSSSEFDYYEWNATGRRQSASHVGADTRRQPKPTAEIDRSHEVRFDVPAGGLVVFAGAQLHASVPNATGEARFSIDFRTADADDLVAGRGVANVDSSPSGTALRDFMRCSDLSRLPDDVVARYDTGTPPPDAVLVYSPDAETAGASGARQGSPLGRGA